MSDFSIRAVAFRVAFSHHFPYDITMIYIYIYIYIYKPPIFVF